MENNKVKNNFLVKPKMVNSTIMNKFLAMLKVVDFNIMKKFHMELKKVVDMQVNIFMKLDVKEENIDSDFDEKKMKILIEIKMIMEVQT